MPDPAAFKAKSRTDLPNVCGACPAAVALAAWLAPPANNVSTSSRPSFWASLPPAIPNAAVPRPDPTAANACLPVKSLSLASCRICSAAEPAPSMPSPRPPATTAPTLGASPSMPRATPAPPIICGNDSPTDVRIVLGF